MKTTEENRNILGTVLDSVTEEKLDEYLIDKTIHAIMDRFVLVNREDLPGIYSKDGEYFYQNETENKRGYNHRGPREGGPEWNRKNAYIQLAFAEKIEERMAGVVSEEDKLREEEALRVGYESFAEAPLEVQGKLKAIVNMRLGLKYSTPE